MLHSAVTSRKRNGDDITDNSSVSSSNPTFKTTSTIGRNVHMSPIPSQYHYHPCCLMFNQQGLSFTMVQCEHNHQNHAYNAETANSNYVCTNPPSNRSSFCQYQNPKPSPLNFVNPSTLCIEQNRYSPIAASFPVNKRSKSDYNAINNESISNIKCNENKVMNKSQPQVLQSESTSDYNGNICNYRDFSQNPPSPQDYEIYHKKRKLCNILYHHQQEQGQDPSLVDSKLNKIFMKRGRGNKALRPDAAAPSMRFLGLMGTNFPARLHDLLSQVSKDPKLSSTISWLPHGRSFIVHDKTEFLKKVSPSHFHFGKYESFLRQVNGWGFQRVTDAPDENSYFHELFLRDMPHLIKHMQRTGSTRTGGKQHDHGFHSQGAIPDFYALSAKRPIPNYYQAKGRNTSNVIVNTNEKAINSCVNVDIFKPNIDCALPSGIDSSQIDSFDIDADPRKNEDKSTSHNIECQDVNCRPTSPICVSTSPSSRTQQDGSSISVVSTSPSSHHSNNDVIQVQNMWIHGSDDDMSNFNSAPLEGDAKTLNSDLVGLIEDVDLSACINIDNFSFGDW